jgi:hypothetical protein
LQQDGPELGFIQFTHDTTNVLQLPSFRLVGLNQAAGDNGVPKTFWQLDSGKLIVAERH